MAWILPVKFVVFLATFEWIFKTSSILSARKTFSSSLCIAFFTISSQNYHIIYLLLLFCFGCMMLALFEDIFEKISHQNRGKSS